MDYFTRMYTLQLVLLASMQLVEAFSFDNGIRCT